MGYLRILCRKPHIFPSFPRGIPQFSARWEIGKTGDETKDHKKKQPKRKALILFILEDDFAIGDGNPKCF